MIFHRELNHKKNKNAIKSCAANHFLTLNGAQVKSTVHAQAHELSAIVLRLESLLALPFKLLVFIAELPTSSSHIWKIFESSFFIYFDAFNDNKM